jgi:hypothetical protein
MKNIYYPIYYKTAQSFLESDAPPVDLIQQYISFANYLLFLDEQSVVSVINKLKKNIISHAIAYSKVYENLDPTKVYSRSDLLNHDDWFVSDMRDQIQMFRTSGSTSGQSFSYGIWNKYVSYLEDESHYGMILDEFGLPKNNLKILELLNLPYNPSIPEGSSFVIESGDSPYTMHTHKSINSTRYFVSFKNYTENSDWAENICNLINTYGPFDLMISSGPFINRLTNFIKNTNQNFVKIAKLLSNTTERLLIEDINFLKDNRLIDNYCDHMRCWDGGAMFFTCKHNTYHLCDNVSWVEQGSENQMLTTDYLSLPAPFVNYWNGDLCEIDNKYDRCACGRLYRPFKMLDSRPFALKGSQKLTEIKRQIHSLDFHESINHIQFANLKAYITIARELTETEKNILGSILDEYSLIYINNH